MKRVAMFSWLKRRFGLKGVVLAVAGVLYAPILVSGQAGICLVPPKWLADEDYLYLAMKWMSENAKRHWRFMPPIRSREEAAAFARKYDGCCTVYEGIYGTDVSFSEQSTDMTMKFFGAKYTHVTLIFNSEGSMDNKVDYYYYVTFDQCGKYVTKESASNSFRPKWPTIESRQSF